MDAITTITFGLGLIGSGIGIYSFIANRAVNAEARFKDLEAKSIDPKIISKMQQDIQKINTTLETKVEPIWSVLMTELPKLLISPHTPRFDELVLKYTNGIEQMSYNEMCELLNMLEGRFDPIHTEEPSKALVAAAMVQVLKQRVSENC